MIIPYLLLDKWVHNVGVNNFLPVYERESHVGLHLQGAIHCDTVHWSELSLLRVHPLSVRFDRPPQKKQAINYHPYLITTELEPIIMICLITRETS